MIRDITFGQFFPGSSVVHRMDPRMKLILTILFITALFIANGVYGYLVITAFLIFTVAISGISVKMLLKSIKPIVPVIIITGIINALYGEGDPILKLWILKITRDGLLRAAYMAVRVIYLIVGTSLLTYTTSPISLTDGIERLCKPLERLNVPVHDWAMMMTIALRFIPTLIEETEKIINAQKARGADFGSGSLINRTKALIPIIVPLFVSAFRRAEELAVAMECRCYRGGKNRTSMKQFHLHPCDYLALTFVCLMIAGLIYMNNAGIILAGI